MSARPERRFRAYRAIIFDLDGTLLELDVDWQEVSSSIGDRLRENGVDPSGHQSWELLDAAEDAGIGDSIHERIAEHEVTGAQTADRLPLADVISRLDCQTAVVSLNAESAVRAALEHAGLLGDVDVVIGRDTVDRRKPDPAPLLEAIRRLDVPPEQVLFVGDSESDRTAAQRAEVDFEFVSALVE